MNISKYIDHTLLKSTTSERDIINLCREAKKHRFHSVCVNSCYVSLTKQLLERSEVKICAVVGFPLGAMSSEAKAFDAKKAIREGANEIDMVINLGYLKSKNYLAVFKDISEVKTAIGRTPLKVILEISELSKNEIIKACEVCLDANVDFIQTSTGIAKGGATLTAVKIIKKTVKDKAKIKAFGDIADLETAQKYIDIGVNRLGSSSGLDIVSRSSIRKTVEKV